MFIFQIFAPDSTSPASPLPADTVAVKILVPAPLSARERQDIRETIHNFLDNVNVRKPFFLKYVSGGPNAVASAFSNSGELLLSAPPKFEAQVAESVKSFASMLNSMRMGSFFFEASNPVSAEADGMLQMRISVGAFLLPQK